MNSRTKVQRVHPEMLAARYSIPALISLKILVVFPVKRAMTKTRHRRRFNDEGKMEVQFSAFNLGPDEPYYDVSESLIQFEVPGHPGIDAFF